MFETRLLIELVEFHDQQGAQSDSYLDEETGGIYEHKLASLMGMELENGTPPIVFLEAAAHLERKRLVRRNLRRPDYPIKGIRPTDKGINTANRWISIRSIYRKRPVGVKGPAGNAVFWMLSSVLLAGFLYDRLVQRFLPF